MSVRKRKWTTRLGVEKEAWVADYSDGQGVRCQKTFKKKKDAEAYVSETHVDIRKGLHVADSASVTVKEAGKLWIEACINGKDDSEPLERATVMQYQSHLDLHIYPFIGTIKLTEINGPMLSAFKNKLRQKGRSPVMVGKVMKSLGSLIGEAQMDGRVAHNAVRDLKRRRKSGDARGKVPLKAGVNYPKPEEIRAIIPSLEGRFRPLIIMAIFTGLRASELRGLTWANIDFEKRLVYVRQRADRFNEFGLPKSKSSIRDVPLSPYVINTLREWKLQFPKHDLVFPNIRGGVASLTNIVKAFLKPAQVRAGVVNKDGKAKYPGFHTLRHFYASWLINRKEDGGMGYPPKLVQSYMGHANIALTMDTYGHLFPNPNVDKDFAEAEKFLIA